ITFQREICPMTNDHLIPLDSEPERDADLIPHNRCACVGRARYTACCAGKRDRDFTPVRRTRVSETINRQWRLRERPAGMVGAEHFSYHEEPIAVPQHGEMLVRTLYVSFDPAMRAFLNDRPSYVAPQKVGDVMRAGAIAQVVDSRADAFARG